MKVRRYKKLGKNVCMFCGMCVAVCPKGAFTFVKSKPSLTFDDKIVYNPSKCNGCGECVKCCPEGVIRFKKTKEKNEKDD